MEKLEMPLRLIKVNCQTCNGEKFTVEVVCCGDLSKRFGVCCDEPYQQQVTCSDCEAKGFYEVKRL